MNPTPYDATFFQLQEQGARRSAAATIPVVLEFVAPRSVVDVGCGVGAWLAEFKTAGVADYLGIDGEYVPRGQLLIESERFTPRDLSQPLAIGRRFDLAACLEVAEHLPAASAAVLVGSLVELAPVVLFSAAVPFQQGVDHINEQWPEYWRDLFATHDYVVVDALRDRLWHNKSIEPWYRQNLLFFVARSRLVNYPRLRAEFERAGDRPHLSRVHPDHYLTVCSLLYNKVKQSQCLAMRLALRLRDFNLIVFPDWKLPHGVLLEQLRSLLAALHAHPERRRLSAVIHFGEQESLGGALTRQVSQEVLALTQAAPETRPHVVGVGKDFGVEQWEVLLACAQGRIILPAEDVQAMAALRVGGLPAIPLEAIQRQQPLPFP